MVEEITLIKTPEEKTFIIDVNKDIITTTEYLNELNARITNLENMFNIKVERLIKK